jgi:putative inorganic carbon (HCO3(-)) transporter
MGAGLALAVTSLVLLIAQSRAAWAALVLGLLGMGALALGRFRIILGVVLAVVVVLVALSGPMEVGTWFTQQPWLVSPGETSWAARVELWSHGLWAIADHPLTGTGMNIFRRIAGHQLPLYHFDYGQDIGHAHQAYIQVALDLGLPGLIAYLALLLGTIGSGWQTYRRSSHRITRHVALAAATGLVIHAIWGFADAIALGARQSFLWWSMLALVATAAIQDRRSSENQPYPEAPPETCQEQAVP